MIDDAFFAAVKRLFVPEMGTDSVAPLLYWLVRMLRPRTVLEVGMGYTTPFLARALDDNAAAIVTEQGMIEASSPDQNPELPLARRAYYDEAYEPRLVCIDRMTDPTSSAQRAFAVIEELGLSSLCHLIKGDLRNSADEVRQTVGLLDLAWIDTWDTLAFMRNYWDMIEPAGGVLAIHWLMTYPEGRAVLRFIESLRGPDGGRLEITNFCEPHKNAQNSLTLVRRVRDYVDPHDLRPTGSSNDPKGTLSA